MKQATLAAAVGFERYAKTTRRVAFLAAMERVVPWSALCALIEPFYPKPGNVRPPIEIEADAAHLSRVAMVQYAEPGGGGGLYDSLAMRRFVDIISGASRCRARRCGSHHLLEAHNLGQKLFDEVQRHLTAKGLKLATATIVDATIINASS